jgi:hypothetical protein
MNEQFFQPRGLYALIMEYQPKKTSATSLMDVQTQVAISAENGGDTGSHFKVSSGGVKDEIQLPMPAPLIIPDRSELEEAEHLNGFQKAGRFLLDYEDRRAQAKFVSWFH